MNTNKIIKQFKEALGKMMKMAVKDAKKFGAAGSAPSETSRAMRFPYTFTAKVIQFPWVYYVTNNWIYKYYMIALVVTFPIFKKIHNVFNSPTNVAKWEAIKAKEREEEKHQHH